MKMKVIFWKNKIKCYIKHKFIQRKKFEFCSKQKTTKTKQREKQEKRTENDDLIAIIIQWKQQYKNK